MTALPRQDPPRLDPRRSRLTVAAQDVTDASSQATAKPGPFRPRATLVPLADDAPDTSPAGDQDRTWYLGASGVEAHLPARANQPTAPSKPSDRRLAPDVSACSVFLTQVRASPTVTRCEVCLRLAATPPTTTTTAHPTQEEARDLK
jgi:hypothetical protein